jgi:hypothetical protein
MQLIAMAIIEMRLRTMGPSLEFELAVFCAGERRTNTPPAGKTVSRQRTICPVGRSTRKSIKITDVFCPARYLV